MSNYFIAYVLIGAVFGLTNFFLRRSQEKRLKAWLKHIENTIVFNANICNQEFIRTDSIAVLLHQTDPLFGDKIAYLQKRIQAHKKNPKHYPFEPNKWLAAFELAHPQNHSIDD